MKPSKIIMTFLIAIMLVSIGAGYVAGYLVYKQYSTRTAELERQTELKYGELQKGLKDFYVTLENTVDANRLDRAKFLAHIEKIKEDLKGWEKGYRQALADLKNEVEDLGVDRLTRMVEGLQNDVYGFKVTIQDLDLKLDEVRGVATDLRSLREQDLGIDLGRISVGSKGNKKK